MFFKKIPTFLILFSLFFPSATYPMGNRKHESSKAPSTDAQAKKKKAASLTGPEISTTIKNLAEEYFVTEKLAAAQKASLISEETKNFILAVKDEIKKNIENGDNEFAANTENRDQKEVPGYVDLKKKALNYLERFCACLGYKKETCKTLTDELLALQKIIESEQEKPGIQKINKKKAQLKNQQQELTKNQEQEMSSPKDDTLVKQKKIKEEIETKEKEIKNLEQKSAVAPKPTDEDIKNTGPHSAFPEFIQLRKSYLEKLRELDETNHESALAFQIEKWGLTLIHAYTWQLEDQKKRLTQLIDSANTTDQDKTQKSNVIQEQKKTYVKTFQLLTALDNNAAQPFVNPEWGAVFLIESNAQQPAGTMYDAYAIGLRGTLYELEAALQAVAHKEKIISFGTIITIHTDEKDEKMHAVTKEIKKHGPESRKDSTQQTFLTPSRTKNTTQNSLSQEFDLVTTNYIIECKCIQGNVDKYISNLNREQFMATLANQITQESGTITVTTEGKNFPDARAIAGKKVVCYIKYTKEYCEDQAAEEIHLMNKGYAIWNGSTYCHAITQAYMDKAHPEYSELKELIRSIGPEKFILHCIIKSEEEEQTIIKKLQDSGITKIRRSENGPIKPTPAGEEKKAALHRLSKGACSRPTTPKTNQRDTQKIEILGIIFTKKTGSVDTITLADLADLANSLEQFNLQSPPQVSKKAVKRCAADSLTHITKKQEIEPDTGEMKIEQQEPERAPQTNMEQADAQMDVEHINQDQQNQSHESAITGSNTFRSLFPQ